MILGEVGKSGHVERHGIHTAKGQGVRGDLHGGRVESLFSHDGQQGMDVGGLGRGQLAGDGFSTSQNLNGADEPGGVSQRLQQGVQEVGCGGLAVGSRDSKEFERIHGLLVRRDRMCHRPAPRPYP